MLSDIRRGYRKEEKDREGRRRKNKKERETGNGGRIQLQCITVND